MISIGRFVLSIMFTMNNIIEIMLIVMYISEIR